MHDGIDYFTCTTVGAARCRSVVEGARWAACEFGGEVGPLDDLSGRALGPRARSASPRRGSRSAAAALEPPTSHFFGASRAPFSASSACTAGSIQLRWWTGPVITAASGRAATKGAHQPRGRGEPHILPWKATLRSAGGSKLQSLDHRGCKEERSTKHAGPKSNANWPLSGTSGDMSTASQRQCHTQTRADTIVSDQHRRIITIHGVIHHPHHPSFIQLTKKATWTSCPEAQKKRNDTCRIRTCAYEYNALVTARSTGRC